MGSCPSFLFFVSPLLTGGFIHAVRLRLPAIDKTPDRVIRLWRNPTWSLSLQYYFMLLSNISKHSVIYLSLISFKPLAITP